MTSQGEEGTCVGSASALAKEDVIFCQYREAGVFAQRGYKFDDFMSQLFANKKDAGKGRNMPVHYGSATLNIVSLSDSLRFIRFLTKSSIQFPLLWQLKSPKPPAQPMP